MKTFYLSAILFIFAFTCIHQPASSQISIPATPPSFELEHLKNDVPLEIMRSVDTKKLLEEDRIFDTIKNIPWRFGDNIMVNIHPGNSGIWETLDNGDKLWRVAVYSEGAYSLNFTFDQYHLPPGAQLFVYNQEKSMVLGAFTDYNNQEDGYFATTLVDGDHIVIEYYEPADASFNGELNLEMVTHAYRNPYEYAKAFGSSGSCNLNVACEEADDWQQQVRSAAMLVTGGNGFCSGALINNTAFDGKPLFLSANHCFRNPSTVVFWFNWQSETCANPPSSPPYNSMSGATQRARNAASDFWLMELNQPIPDEYNPYYAGWNRTLANTLTEFITGVHHPRGDIKKFSYAQGGVQQASYLGAPNSGTTHWRIVWSGGTTTEPGSSGSPIFDSQGRILGQLHGGYAACGNTQPDWYGRIGVSWTGGGSAATRLSNWLDPQGSDVTALDGYDPFFAGVTNPEDFQSTVLSENQILLDWTLNDSLNNVMIAWNNENTFGVPLGAYTLGDEIEGGGQVLYLGNDEELSHNHLLPNKTYYYRIWSYSSELIYSNGTGSSATTPCAAVYSFPFFEGFNDAEVPGCWTQQFVAGEVQWQIGVGNNDGYPFNAHEGASNIFFRTNTVPEIGSKTKLITPLIDFSNRDAAELSFWYANPASQANQDILRIYYRLATDSSWVELATFGANQFNWTHALIPLPELSSQMQIAFEGEGNRGRGISVDQVEIFVTTDVQLPNPVNLTVSLINGNQPQLQWEIDTEEDKEDFAFDGFNVYRNETLISKGNDPLQDSFADQPLPVGTYTWYVKSRSGETLLSPPSNEVTAEIEVAGNEAELIVINTGEGATSLPQGEYLILPGSQISITATPASNWYFSHWNINGEDAGSLETLAITIDNSTELEAVFLINHYQVTLQAEPEDAATILSGDGEYDHGTVAQFAAYPAPGYIFLHWKDENRILSTNPNMQLAVTEDKNLTAWFAEQYYELALAVYPEDAGTVSGAGVFGANEEVSVQAEPADEWQFSYWALVTEDEEEQVSNESEFTFVLSGNILLVAYFEPFVFTPNLEISLEGNGTTMPEPGIHTYTLGEEVVLTATADEGWEFIKWVINDEDILVSQLLLNIEEDLTALAVFGPVTAIAQASPERVLRIYPVPASTLINVELPGNGEWKLSVLNITGQLVKTAIAESHARIGINGLPPGIYLLKAEKDGVVLHSRFIAE
ncbi:MAG: T9SS C-terminal target domain-containing protein [Bacteroidetes bacterium]|nr:MAG: T9SS C-terminal target domain-containing protein [Bacteroidota bacterium]